MHRWSSQLHKSHKLSFFFFLIDPDCRIQTEKPYQQCQIRGVFLPCVVKIFEYSPGVVAELQSQSYTLPAMMFLLCFTDASIPYRVFGFSVFSFSCCLQLKLTLLNIEVKILKPVISVHLWGDVFRVTAVVMLSWAFSTVLAVIHSTRVQRRITVSTSAIYDSSRNAYLPVNCCKGILMRFISSLISFSCNHELLVKISL